MKHFLVILSALGICFAIGVWMCLSFPPPPVQRPDDPSLIVAMWRDFDDKDPIQVMVYPSEIVVEVLEFNVRTQQHFQEMGHWTDHVFYGKPQPDATEIMLARQLPNEDLELDLGHFMPGRYQKIVAVKAVRGKLDDCHPYGDLKPGLEVKYPPPKGLIRVGTLEADLHDLPWVPDRVDLDETGTYYASSGLERPDMEPPEIFHYRSDDPRLDELVVRVHHGKVTEVEGGREDTDDPPYVPGSSLDEDATPAPKPESPLSWWIDVLDYFLKK